MGVNALTKIWSKFSISNVHCVHKIHQFNVFFCIFQINKQNCTKIAVNVADDW